ncbi:MAG TPA: chemotaxis response regulator protein-glutamate methylesterase [Planctomycetes bacterium]|nr:chemotaxis response regulator protein-glutamate methylesterase [Planctomycetota bacterium]
MSEPVRVLVVDDSGVHRAAIQSYLESCAGIEVLAVARDGAEGAELTRTLRPQLVLMDVRMPIMDGLEATEQIMANTPTPILLMTAAEYYDQEVDLGLRALSRGALELIRKPDLTALRGGEDQSLARRIKLLATVPVISHPHRKRRSRVKDSLTASGSQRPTTGLFKRASRVVLIVASTGGPQTLRRILERLPGNLPAAIVIVQHIDKGFEEGLARWLDEQTELSVQLGQDGDALMEGVVLLAPQGSMAEVTGRRFLQLREPRRDESRLHCPSGDALLTSGAHSYGRNAVGVVLTGIGRDGTKGLLAMRDSGGRTLAQDEQSSVVYGMPRAAAEAGAAEQVLSIEGIAGAITELLG